jgi:hypothetical protein
MRVFQVSRTSVVRPFIANVRVQSTPPHSAVRATIVIVGEKDCVARNVSCYSPEDQR